jgi:FolB domain-containing protein
MQYDRIYIRDLLCRCIIGFNEEERREKQDVIVNAVLHTDLTVPCRTDDIGDSLNYKLIKKEIISLVEGSSFSLLERLAEDIANLCLKHERVEQVQVCVDKPGALRFSRSVAVEIVRSRPQR